MDEDTSIDTPFANLPEFVKEHKIRLKKFKEIEIQAGAKDKDDRSLLTEAMQGVKAINKRKKRIINKPDTRRLKADLPKNSQKLLEEAIQENHKLNVTNLPEYMEGYTEGVNSLTMEKLKSGEFSVQETLDLHGYSIDDAGKLFEFFIRDAVRAGLHCVKVIHGRGLKSKHAPVLKENLKTWIAKAMHRKWVIAFSNAIMKDGGPGATYILLKRKPVKKRIHIIG
jgi:DNA-nicking Smr family endonuclease